MSEETPAQAIIAVYPSTLIPTHEAAKDLLKHAPGMPFVDPNRPALKLEVGTAWLEGNEQSGKVYATLVERTGPNILPLEYLKMKELAERGKMFDVRKF